MKHINLSIKSTVIISSLLLTACAGKAPIDLGISGGSELRPCPDKPNCVQTYTPTDESHFQLPLAAKASDEKTKQAITAAISETGGQVISEEPLKPSGYYLHAEYESSLFSFVDDVEVVIKDDLIHLRSASRLGYSDLGANADRLEEIKTAYDQ